MIIRKTRKYYQDKARIDKAVNKRTAYKIQVYNNNIIDKYVESYNSDAPTVKPTNSMLWADLAILNKPEVYKNYNRIINSKYTSNEALDKILVKNKANAELNRIVEAEVERITKNLQYVEQVMSRYEVPMKMYNDLKAKQASKSMANRQQILKNVAIKANDLLVSEGLNIPSNVFSYKNLEASAENLLRQSQMQSKHEEINAINENYIADGKDALYNGKEWIWTGEGATTRHASNDHQQRKINEPFIIVNDETLDIDELMYPSDPAGSPGNTFVCYCDIEYLTDFDQYDEDQVHLNSDAFKNHTDPLEAHVAINEPLSKVMFADSLINGLTGEPIKFDTVKPEPVGEFIDTTDVFYSEYKNAYMFDKIVDDIDFNFEFDKALDKWTVNGLPVDIKANKFEGGYIKPETIEAHNKQFIPEAEQTTTDNNVKTELSGEFIDTNKIEYAHFDNEYMLDASDGAYLNANGKWEYKGLEADKPMLSGEGGYWNEKSIEEHNKKFNTDTAKDNLEDLGLENVLTAEPKPLDIDALEPGMLSGEYKLPKDFDTSKIETVGAESNSAGEVVSIATKEAIENYNKQFKDINDIKETVKTDTTVNDKAMEDITVNAKKPIDTSLLEELDSESYYIDSTYDVKYNAVTGKYEYNGLEVKGYSEKSPGGWIDKVDVEAHNKSLGQKPPAEETVKITMTESKTVKNPDKIIDTTEMESFDEFYLFENGNELGVKLNEKTGKYELNGIELDTYHPDSAGGRGAIYKYEVDKYNEKYNPPQKIEKDYTDERFVEVVDGKNYVKDTRTLIVEDYDNGKRYAVDKDGRKWLIDTDGITRSSAGTAEKYQHAIQSKIDMTDQYRGVNDFGYGGYTDINRFIMNRKTFAGDHYKAIFNEAKPILDAIRKNTFEGKSIEKHQQDLNTLTNKLKRNGESEIATLIEEINEIDMAHAKAPPLAQDTLVVRFTPWNEEFNRTGKGHWEAPQSTSYQEGGKEGFNAPYKYKVTIKIPEGHKGVALSDQFDGITSEREWMSPRMQDFDVLEYDEDAMTATIQFTNNIVGLDL